VRFKEVMFVLMFKPNWIKVGLFARSYQHQ